MSRTSSVLLWILIGAVASGSGIGYFLHSANQDRSALSAQVEQARQDAEQAKADTEKLTKDANDKLTAAAIAVADAQKKLDQLTQERELLARATTLAQPDPVTLRTWGTAFSIPLGVTMRIPPGNHMLVTDHELNISTGPLAGAGMQNQWVSITAYDASKEQALVDQLVSPEAVSFSVDGRLLIGQKGTMENVSGAVYVLHTFSDATSTHLLWARSNNLVTEKKVLQTLSTISIR